MKKTVSLIILACIVLLSFSACGCEHEWQEATCNAPRTCSLCGETEGEALGHEWTDADCENPKTCSRCGETEGEPLGHTPGEWEAENSNALGGKEVQRCTVCGEIIETRDPERGEKKEVTVLEPSGLVMSAEDFANHLINYLPADCYISGIGSTEFSIKGSVDVTVYYDDEEHNYKDNIGFSSNDAADVKYLLPYIIPAVDPKVSGSRLDQAVSQAETNLNNRADAVVLLSTGVGYTHYTRPVSLTSMTLPASYWFYFFTLQGVLS